VDHSDLTLEAVAVASQSDFEILQSVVNRQLHPYRSFDLKKRSGGTRTLAIPVDEIRPVQTWILKNLLQSVPPHSSSYAYTTGRSVRLCAERHLGGKWLLRMDLVGFFESIDERSVYYVLLKELGLTKVLSYQLARLVTVEDVSAETYVSAYRSLYTAGHRPQRRSRLPQGASTSGALANLVARNLDNRVTALARSEALTYTRYADDLFLSSDKNHNREYGARLIGKVSDAIRLSGFEVNEAKTKLTTKGSALQVLGLHVDGDSLRLSQEFKRRIDGHLRALRVFGIQEHAEHLGHRHAGFLLAEIEGLLGYANDVSKGWARPRRDEFVRLLDAYSIHRLPFGDPVMNNRRFPQVLN